MGAQNSSSSSTEVSVSGYGDSIQYYLKLYQIKPEKVGEVLAYLKKKDYQVDGELGTGAFGVVLSGVNAKGEQVAIKVIDVQQSEVEKESKEEVEILNKIESKNVIKLIDYFYASEIKVYFIISKRAGESLEKILDRNAELSEEQVIKIIKGIVLGLKDLHDQGIIHSDLKPSNILLSEDFNNVVICDLGLASFKDSQNQSLRRQKGKNLFYCAPEQHMGTVGYGSDIYAAGMILIQLCSPQMSTSQILKEESKLMENFRFPNLAQIGQKMKEYLISDRMNLEEVLEKIHIYENEKEFFENLFKEMKNVQQDYQQQVFDFFDHEKNEIQNIQQIKE